MMRQRARTPATFAVVAVLLMAAAPLSGPSPEGEWAGRYTTSEAGGELALRITPDGTGWQVLVRATSAYHANPSYRPAEDVTVSGDSVAFTMHWGTTVRWTGMVRGDSLSGVMNADHWAGTWVAHRR